MSRVRLACQLRLVSLDQWNLWVRLTRCRIWQGPEGASLGETYNACERATGS